jgi:hypothetical protein
MPFVRPLPFTSPTGDALPLPGDLDGFGCNILSFILGVTPDRSFFPFILLDNSSA